MNIDTNIPEQHISKQNYSTLKELCIIIKVELIQDAMMAQYPRISVINQLTKLEG